MRKASLDLQLELPLAAGVGDQMALPLEDKPLPYRLRRNDGSSIRVSVEGGVVSVSAPRHVRLSAIEAALRERRTSVMPGPLAIADLPQNLRDGTLVPFLGTQVELKLADGGHSRLTGSVLELALPGDASAARIRDTLHGWLQMQAKVVFEEAVASLPSQPAWSMSFARSALASVDPDGRLRLNWRLVLLSRESITRLLEQLPRQAVQDTQQIDLLADGDNEPATTRTTRASVPRAPRRR